jgi:hypothetical protein
MPITATLVYTVAAAAGLDRLPVSTIVYYYLTGPAGFVLFISAIAMVFWLSNPAT